MSEATLYCTNAKRYDWQYDDWYPFNQSFSGISNLGVIGYIPRETGYRIGIQEYTFQPIPEGAAITAATLHMKFVRYTGYSTPIVRMRISNADVAYTTSAPSGYQEESIYCNTTLTEHSIDITAQVQNYGVAGSTLYLYVYLPYDVYGIPGTDYTQAIALSTPTIEITYADADTVGRYNGSAFENCEVYRYNGSTFERCEAYRYDGTEFVQCSTT